jgi:hypothetical protein
VSRTAAEKQQKNWDQFFHWFLVGDLETCESSNPFMLFRPLCTPVEEEAALAAHALVSRAQKGSMLRRVTATTI